MSIETTISDMFVHAWDVPICDIPNRINQLMAGYDRLKSSGTVMTEPWVTAITWDRMKGNLYVPNEPWAHNIGKDDVFLNDPRYVNFFQNFSYIGMHDAKVIIDKLSQIYMNTESRKENIILVAYHFVPVIGMHKNYDIYQKIQTSPKKELI